MLKFRTQPNPGKILIERLYDGAVLGSRNPDLYARMGAPDTVEGRFELLTAHILLMIERLNAAGDRGAAVGQMLFDLYVRNLDGALREMGVGDLAVGKRMKGLGRLFYGRAVAYRDAFASGDPAALRSLVGRTVLAERPGASPDALAAYFIEEKRRLDASTDDDLLAEAGDEH